MRLTSDITFIQMKPSVFDALILPAESRVVELLQKQRVEMVLPPSNMVDFDPSMPPRMNDEHSRIPPAFTQGFEPSGFQELIIPDDIDKFDNRNTVGERVAENMFSTYGMTPEEAFGSFGYSDGELIPEGGERNK